MTQDSGLDGVLAEIETRAAVEMAKLDGARGMTQASRPRPNVLRRKGSIVCGKTLAIEPSPTGEWAAHRTRGTSKCRRPQFS